MALSDLLWMTKPKLVLLAVFLVALVPKYYNSNCGTGTCLNATTNPLCQCGFSFANFFTIFILAYLGACIIVEIYNIAKKMLNKKS